MPLPLCDPILMCVLYAGSAQGSLEIINLIEEVMSIASSDDIKALDSLTNLKRVKNNLKTGKVRAGVVGLTNSGKSTFLNALLGKQYLPASVQSQTAKEVSIIHTPDSPGELWASKQKNDDPVRIAIEWESVRKQLLTLNEEVRQGDVLTFQKLSLHAPILFLDGVENVNLEVSDTPGLYEAAAGNASVDSEIAVKEMSAFIMILNLRFLKIESEVNIMKSLIQNHPNVFSKLSRIVILVNAYDVAFLDDNVGGRKPCEIPSYVAEYLQDPEIIGINITADQIIAFSAKWALYARMWSANPAVFLEMENAKLLYDEAVILTQRATNFESDWKPFEQATAEDIERMCSLLWEISHMALIEEHLKTMLYKNGPSILLEATSDDSIAQILSILSKIDTNIEMHDIKEKQAVFSCYEKLLKRVDEFEYQISSVQPPVTPISEVSSITETLRGTFTNKFNSIFQNHLIGFHLNPDRNVVFNRICGMKPLLTSAANAELQASWTLISSIINQRNIEHAKIFFSELKITFIAALNSFANNNPTCSKLALDLSGKLSPELDRIDPNTMSPKFPGIQVHIDGTAIANDRLNHILMSYETKWKTVEWRKKKRGGWFRGSKRKRMYKSESYQGGVYSPDITAIQNVLAADATNPWVQSFYSSVNSTIVAVSNQLVELLVNASKNVLGSVRIEVTQAVESSRQVLKISQETVDRLTVSKNTLIRIEKVLKKLISQN